MPNVNDLKKSKFLKRSDIPRPVSVTIQRYEEVNIAMEGAEEEMKWALYFKELEKPLVLNSTNGQIIATIIGSDEFDDWLGHKIILYDDKTVIFKGKVVGGIRIREVDGQAPPVKPTEEKMINNAKNSVPLKKAQKQAGLTQPDDDIPF